MTFLTLRSWLSTSRHSSPFLGIISYVTIFDTRRVAPTWNVSRWTDAWLVPSPRNKSRWIRRSLCPLTSNDAWRTDGIRVDPLQCIRIFDLSQIVFITGCHNAYVIRTKLSIIFFTQVDKSTSFKYRIRWGKTLTGSTLNSAE